MADLVICNKQDLVAVADAVRSKTGESTGMKLEEIPSKISGISGSADSVLKTVQVQSVWSEDTKWYYFMMPDGSYEEIPLNTTSFTMGAPSFILFCSSETGLNDSNFTGYRLLRGGQYIYIDGSACGIYVDGSAPVVFEYVASDNEPT